MRYLGICQLGGDDGIVKGKREASAYCNSCDDISWIRIPLHIPQKQTTRYLRHIGVKIVKIGRKHPMYETEKKFRIC